MWCPVCRLRRSSPKGLSRLKGIETDASTADCRELWSPKGLSRLKGIETINTLCLEFPTIRFTSERTFPFEGNWNTHGYCGESNIFLWGPKGLSRLKGIETILLFLALKNLAVDRSERTFPFEGNWNTSHWTPLSHLRGKVRKDFPVWRELKLWIRPDGGLSSPRVRKDFPVWRELKPIGYTPWRKNAVTFVRKDFPVWRELKRFHTRPYWGKYRTVFVRKDFPVWRELKLNSRPPRLSTLNTIFAVRKDFPVWRELKQNLRFLCFVSEEV